MACGWRPRVGSWGCITPPDPRGLCRKEEGRPASGNEGTANTRTVYHSLAAEASREAREDIAAPSSARAKCWRGVGR